MESLVGTRTYQLPHGLPGFLVDGVPHSTMEATAQAGLLHRQHRPHRGLVDGVLHVGVHRHPLQQPLLQRNLSVMKKRAIQRFVSVRLKA